MISVNSANYLYWLGRNAERAETISKEAIKSFDLIIDHDIDDGKKLFKKLDIKLNYRDESDFLKQVVFGEHASSVYSSLLGMKENSTLCRSLIHSDAFAYVNKAYMEIRELKNKTVEVYDIEHLLAGLYGFDGMINSTLIRPEAAKLIDFGKVIERIDLEIRLYDDLNVVLFELDELYALGKSLDPAFEKPAIVTDKKAKLLIYVNSLVKGVIKS